MLAFSGPHREQDERRRRRQSLRKPVEEVREVSVPARAGTRRTIEDDFRERVKALSTSIDLASACDLSAHPRVAASILNYGRPDVTGMTADPNGLGNLPAALRRALERHEPGIVEGSLSIGPAEDATYRHGFDAVSQSLRFEISLDLAFAPLPIPIKFHAEIDVAAGKLEIDVAGPS
nr:GPW/gp25 family protein [Jiella avicenniae]